ncbi:MAG: AAA family ATPase [Betaproteobacteria bacterium]|nr:AAA family ATPase [Betaproteobacteria bacterium]
MARMMEDQAEGLRRLQVSDAVRIVTVAGGRTGVGKTSAVVNLAMALAKNGKHVLVLDENPRHNNVNINLGLKARYDLLHVIHRDKTLEQVILPGPDGISVLTAMRGVHCLAKLNRDDQEWLIKSFSKLPKPVDVVLVDTAAGSTGHVLSLGLAAQQVLVVLSGVASSITDGYALIKVMSQEYARRHFLIVVNNVRSEQDARAIFDNISQVAKRHLSVALDLVGCIPADEKLRRSAQLCRPVVDAFPASMSAAGFRKMADNLLRCPCPGDYGGVENEAHRASHDGEASRQRAGG